MKRFLPWILLLSMPLLAFNNVFQTKWTVWQQPEFSLLTTSDSALHIDAEEFCRGMMLSNVNLAKARCRIAGDWERDSASAVYLHWLKDNIQLNLEEKHLASRNPQVAERIRTLSDTYLLTLIPRQDTLWLLLFSGNPSFLDPHSMTEPAALAYQTPLPTDSRKLGALIASEWFRSEPERRLSEAEQQAVATIPNEAYSETPRFESWVALGGGWSQATLPLTPKSWYASKRSSRIVGYNQVHDSLSAWNFLEDESPIMTVRTGFTWNGFFGLELFGLRSTHKAKIDPNDPIYAELDHWDFTRYEIGLTAHGTLHERLSPSWEWQPYGFIGFHYSYLIESIGFNPDVTPSQESNYRIQFAPFYKGAIFGVGSRFQLLGGPTLDLRTGLNNRGRSLDQEPSTDAVREATVIGGSTLDGFVSAALEYHWRRKN